MSTTFNYIEPESAGKIISERYPEGMFDKEHRMFERVYGSKGMTL